MSDIYKQAEEQRREKITKIPVEETSLPNKIKTTLINAGYSTIGDIVEGLKNNKIGEVKGIGEKAIKKLSEFIEKQNLPDKESKPIEIDKPIVIDEEAIKDVYSRMFSDSTNSDDLELQFIIEVLKDRLRCLEAERKMHGKLETYSQQLEFLVLCEVLRDER